MSKLIEHLLAGGFYKIKYIWAELFPYKSANVIYCQLKTNHGYADSSYLFLHRILRIVSLSFFFFFSFKKDVRFTLSPWILLQDNSLLQSTSIFWSCLSSCEWWDLYLGHSHITIVINKEFPICKDDISRHRYFNQITSVSYVCICCHGITAGAGRKAYLFSFHNWGGGGGGGEGFGGPRAGLALGLPLSQFMVVYPDVAELLVNLVSHISFTQSKGKIRITYISRHRKMEPSPLLRFVIRWRIYEGVALPLECRMSGEKFPPHLN